MPIYRDKKRGCFVFEFDRRIEGRRVRAQKVLPRTWNQAQADAFDRKESARLYALAHTVGGAEYTIDEAVAVYLRERIPQLKHGMNTARELALMIDFFENRPLSALADVCTAYRKRAKNEQTGEPLAPATIKNRIRYLTAACRYAWKHAGMGESDPAAKVAVPTVRNERRVFLSRAEMLELARASKDRGVRALVRIAFYSGLRFGEIMRAEIVGTAFVLRDTKNGDPRIVPIHPKIRACQDIRPTSRFTFDYHFSKARQAVGRPDLHFHDLRHSAASAMLAAGVDLHTVGAVLGHRSTQSTRRYAHFVQGHLEDAIFRVGRKAA